MIDVENLFKQINDGMALAKMKVDGCPVGVYYGRSESGNLRLAFLTENPPVIIESTAHLKVSQWAEGTNVYWSCFELLTESAKQVFYVLCNNLIRAAIGTSSEELAMVAIKNRFATWKKLFKNPSSEMSLEAYKGLFGELYFLKNWLIGNHDANIAVNSWSGSDKTAKDFSISTIWYEIKTVSTNAETVKISSLTQLDSEYTGNLVLVKTEQMSDEFDNGECSVEQVMKGILEKLSDESVKDDLVEKIVRYGYDVNSNSHNFHKYRVSKMCFYKVDAEFPKITNLNVPHPEIVRVTYELSISSIDKYLEGEK